MCSGVKMRLSDCFTFDWIKGEQQQKKTFEIARRRDESKKKNANSSDTQLFGRGRL